MNNFYLTTVNLQSVESTVLQKSRASLKILHINTFTKLCSIYNLYIQLFDF